MLPVPDERENFKGDIIEFQGRDVNFVVFEGGHLKPNLLREGLRKFLLTRVQDGVARNRLKRFLTDSA